MVNVRCASVQRDVPGGSIPAQIFMAAVHGPTPQYDGRPTGVQLRHGCAELTAATSCPSRPASGPPRSAPATTTSTHVDHADHHHRRRRDATTTTVRAKPRPPPCRRRRVRQSTTSAALDRRPPDDPCRTAGIPADGTSRAEASPSPAWLEAPRRSIIGGIRRQPRGAGRNKEVPDEPGRHRARCPRPQGVGRAARHGHRLRRSERPHRRLRPAST